MPTRDQRIHHALDGFRIELPSWGFANTGTRFGKFLQPAAATTLEEKFSDAGQVHALTGVLPDRRAARPVGSSRRGRQCGRDRAAVGAPRRPRRFDQPEPLSGSGATSTARSAILTPRSGSGRWQHVLESVAIAAALGSRDISLWFADGSNYPGTANIRQRTRVVRRESARQRTPH